ncbi:DUF421 domain-containing protein [Virgibacillus sp. SK37]|uniref:DUF421 domain-containing protein n=1 Tax=Virgibacillus sp. SK37 TaxID=403957 RepID=UPI0004D1E28C|nr:DUF421 domain-containing protein [Virgibacillus sp. SK37]AIF44841.1 hypothetical protein X953_18295 [Virgibacillus sp. SK37]
MAIPELVLRICLSFLLLFTLTRIMGRKEISQMTFFNFVSAIAIGSIAAILATNQNFSMLNGFIALTGWAGFTLGMGYIDIKSQKARKFTTGIPEIVIKDGKIMEEALRRKRLDNDSLQALLRQKNIFSMKEVDYAIFETSGKLSVMKKENKQPATKSDVNQLAANLPKVYPIATEVISDGELNETNLKKLNLDTNWLNAQLKQAGITSLSEVFYAEVQSDGTLYLDNKRDNLYH